MKKLMSLALSLMLLLSAAACSAAPTQGGVSSAVSASESKTESEAESKPESKPESKAESKPESKAESKAESGPEPESETTAETIDAGEGTVEIRGGSNQNDAVLVPLNTKMYGFVDEGEKSWFAFTTTEAADAVYRLTLIHKTVGAQSVVLRLVDEDGNEMTSIKADNDGRAVTKEIQSLQPGTVYYFAVNCMNDRVDDAGYMLIVRSPEEEGDARRTTDSLLEAGGEALSQDGSVTPGFNQDDAAMIPIGSKISGTVKDGLNFWFAFRTTGSKEASYKLTAVHETQTSENPVSFSLFDGYGNELKNFKASSDGTASTLEVSGLKEDTVYYVAAYCFSHREDTLNYTLTVKAVEPAGAPAASVESAEPELVFETPFELNSTQVMFQINQAVFLNEADAKKALEPVAEIILAHPDHPILLAGTTATDGTQASCVDLSNRRAAAVKELLVSEFGVPESQLLTVGLGYENDPFVRGKDRDANGNFVETEGAKNRRVVVLDAADPIAKEILGD